MTVVTHRLQPPEHMERNGRAYSSPPPWMAVVRPQWPGTNFEVPPPDHSSSATQKLHILTSAPLKPFSLILPI
jgi:hypothetical protein